MEDDGKSEKAGASLLSIISRELSFASSQPVTRTVFRGCETSTSVSGLCLSQSVSQSVSQYYNLPH